MQFLPRSEDPIQIHTIYNPQNIRAETTHVSNSVTSPKLTVTPIHTPYPSSTSLSFIPSRLCSVVYLVFVGLTPHLSVYCRFTSLLPTRIICYPPSAINPRIKRNGHTKNGTFSCANRPCSYHSPTHTHNT